MGHPLILQALPVGSRLYARLASDRKVGTLFAQLFNHGGGPYTWARMPDLGEVLGDVAEMAVFASQAEVDGAMTDLLAGLEGARADHPGLEGRRVFLEKTQWDIEDRLARELRRRGRADAGGFARAILFGAGPLTQPGVEGPLGDGLRVVPPPTVREAAQVLATIEPDGLFDQTCEENVDYLCADYRALRAFYSAAAGYGEAVVVGD